MSHIRNIVAVLGPTNTGKTHYAIDQMLAHHTAMIGLPLRLLAREVFDKICERIGSAQVALVTGEEKIIPDNARYWVCTTEAMPKDHNVDFLAIDEIQLCSDRERGHVFTDRLLHWRGRSKTMFLGAQTMRPVIASLLGDVRFETRERLSRLTYAGEKRMARLPKRSAVVGFSGEMVYSVAELIRRKNGGAAVVMGNLSPRTRNAQVGLYQSGEVDFLVATDAIGMGLNMDINHIAFASLRKFDGSVYRQLQPAELGQIAGRAGRYKADGTFGVTGNVSALDPDLIECLESHQFEAVKVLQWRNRNLSFSSLDHLAASFKALPNKKGLARAKPAADILALEVLARDDEVVAGIGNAQDVERLWGVCQLPDYRNISVHDHAALIAKIYQFLSGPTGVIGLDWFERQLSFCNNFKGDIDTLSNRISHIRTWTFVANRSGWLEDPVYWQERTREIEDKLSDALHQALIQRFIDRRTSVLMKKLRQKENFMSTVEEDGTVKIEGEVAGKLTGLCFKASGNTTDNGALKAATNKAIADEIAGRAASLIAVPDQDISLDDDGALVWQGGVVGRLSAGESQLKPVITLVADDGFLQGPERDAVLFRLQKFIDRHLAAVLGPLIELQEDETITGLARGVAFRIIENYGVMERAEIAQDIKSLDQTLRGTLRKHGIRFGAFHIFMPNLLKPAPTKLRVLLWSLQQKQQEGLVRKNIAAIPGQGLTSAVYDEKLPAAFYQVAGYKVCGERIVRIDMLERLGDEIRKRVFWRSMSEADTRPEGSVEGGGFTVVADMMSLVGCSGKEFSEILKALGYLVEQRKIVKPLSDHKPADADKGSEAVEPENEGANTAFKMIEDDSQNKGGKEVEEAQDKPQQKGEPVSGLEVSSDQDNLKSEDVPEVLEVWWPRDTGPFRKKTKRPFKNKEKPKTDGRKRPNKKHIGGQKPSQKSKRTPIDPKDSPFAALQALKQQMKK